MRTIKKIARYALLILLMYSCKNDTTRILPKVSGSAGEVIVVMSNYNWDGKIGEKLREILAKDYPMLPQSEPAFKLIHIPPNGFNNIFQLNRSIIILKDYKTDVESSMQVQTDVWALTQVVVNLIGSGEDKILEELDQNSDKLYNLLENEERKRIQSVYLRSKKVAIDDKLKKEHGVSLTVPSNFNLDVDTTDFVWISHETPDISQGIFIYHYPYDDDSTFTKDYLVNKRNKYLKKYVPGPVDGSYMSTVKDFSDFEEFSFKSERYVTIMRGLWKVENAFMGGPYISLTTLDEERNRIVTIEGYVYAPKKEKITYVRQLEAVLFSFDIVKEKSDN